jgi:hypothetical protein
MLTTDCRFTWVETRRLDWITGNADATSQFQCTIPQKSQERRETLSNRERSMCCMDHSMKDENTIKTGKATHDNKHANKFKAVKCLGDSGNVRCLDLCAQEMYEWDAYLYTTKVDNGTGGVSRNGKMDGIVWKYVHIGWVYGIDDVHDNE